MLVVLTLIPPCPANAGRPEALAARAPRTRASAPREPAEDENASKAKAIVDQAIAALGGDAWLNIQDIEQEGRTYGFGHNGESGTGLLFWRWWKWPNQERLELTKQRDWIVIHNGDDGFEITFHGTNPEEKEALAAYLLRRHYSLEQVLRNWIHEPGVAFFYDGPVLAERKQAEQVTIMNGKTEAVTLFIDQITHLPIKKSFTRRDPASREKDTEEETYANYHTVQGIATPYDTARTHNGMMQNQRFLNTVRYNVGVAADKFVATVAVRKK